MKMSAIASPPAEPGIPKGKLFGSGQQDDNGPSKEDDEEDNSLVDHFAIHQAISFRCIFLKNDLLK
jgi:hypothetical protein